jgi:hypothetical protein
MDKAEQKRIEEQIKLENSHYINNRRLEIIVDPVCENFEGQCRHKCVDKFLLNGIYDQRELVIDAITLISDSYWPFVHKDAREHFYYLNGIVQPTLVFHKFLYESHK